VPKYLRGYSDGTDEADFSCPVMLPDGQASSSEDAFMDPESGGACYGGFTYKDLWHPTPDSSGTMVQFNVSM
jgi:hypothetical protein